MKGFIYKITSPSGLIYIGQTINFNKRMSGYKKRGAKSQTALNNSLNKYGIDNHIIEILEEVDVNDLFEKEIFYINKFDSVKNGLNIHKGGKGGRTWQDSDKREDVINLLKQRKGNLNPNFGNHFKHSEETKEKMRLNNKTPKGSLNFKAKSYICIETNEIFGTIKEIAIKYNVTDSAIIISFKKKNNTFRGMHFQLKTI